MDRSELIDAIGPALAGALEKKGFAELTPVQLAVLDPALADRDLRISSQTGSGKTVALGFVLRDLASQPCPAAPGVARPRIIIVAPTRELAKQVEEELGWLYAPLRVRVASATGGASYRIERRALGAAPSIVVGTPGRLIDHLQHGVIDASNVAAVVLDEADRMLEMGFREELDAILAHVPDEHRTHLVSATFPREVTALANRVQRNAVSVEGTRLGEANSDIEHVVHLIDPEQRVDAIVNLLLAHPDEQMLIFARTRAEVVTKAGLAAGSLSGELEQAARDRALASFRKGDTRALVATDVAARGIDVLTIGRVIHADPPMDSDSYTHRSGRTGRAGRKGISSVLAPASAFRRTVGLLRAIGIRFRLEPVPSAEEIEQARDARLFAELTSPEPEGFKGYDDRLWALGKRLAEEGDATRVIVRLLQQLQRSGQAAPRNVRVIKPPADRKPERTDGPRWAERDSDRNWATFRISWGKVHGADTRRILAIVCRRGGIEGSDVGTIRVGPTFSSIEVKAHVAGRFAEAAAKPDPRNPRMLIREDNRASANKPERAPHGKPGGDKPYQKHGGDKPPRKRSR